MIRKGLTEFRVGVFISIGLLLAMVIIFMVGGQHRLFERHYTYFTNFQSISGLRIGAPVQLAGLKVGFVDKINFSTDPDKREITVVLKVQTRFHDRIRGDSVATVETQGLLGDKFIYIAMGSEAQAAIPDRGIVPSKETTSIFSLAEKAGSIMDDIGNVSSSINELLGTMRGKKGDGDLKAITSSLRKSFEQIEKGKGLMHALIYDPKGEEIISSISDALSSAQDGVGGAKRGSLISNLRQASADLKVILDSVKRGEGTLGKMVNDPALYDDLRTLFGRANRNRLLRAVIRSTISENDSQLLK